MTTATIFQQIKREIHSGSHQWWEKKMVNLLELVNSFIDKGYGVVVEGEDENIDFYPNSDFDDEDPDVEEMKDSLKVLFASESGNEDETRRKTTEEVQKAWRRVNSPPSSSDFKRQLMAQLRDQGVDAGLCKSKWEKSGNIPAGYYEYVDVNINKTRYIINISMAEEFEIARPSKNYVSLLNVFPQISICKVEEVKKVVRIMCDAMKKSMNQQQLLVPPWRSYGYIQAKWSRSYKRITNELTTKSVADFGAPIGVLSFTGRSWHQSRRKEDFGVHMKVGNLAMIMNGAS